MKKVRVFIRALGIKVTITSDDKLLVNKLVRYNLSTTKYGFIYEIQNN
jgi:hypothetical protein